MLMHVQLFKPKRLVVKNVIIKFNISCFLFQYQKIMCKHNKSVVCGDSLVKWEDKNRK